MLVTTLPMKIGLYVANILTGPELEVSSCQRPNVRKDGRTLRLEDFLQRLTLAKCAEEEEVLVKLVQMDDRSGGVSLLLQFIVR